MSAHPQPTHTRTAKQCRAEALRLSEMARDANDPRVRETYLLRARDWGRMALGVEANEIAAASRKARVW